jgi:hypothetical protein
MLTILRRNRRARRRANFDLESLDARLVLSAAAAGVVAEAAGSKAAIIEHRREVRAEQHEAKLARMEARHEAKLARSADPIVPVTLTITGGSTAASAQASTAASTQVPSGTVTTGTSASPKALVLAPVTVVGSGTSTSGTSSSSPGTLPSTASAALQALYQEYESQGGGSSFTPSLPSDKLLQISGTSVVVSLKIGSSSNFSTALSQLQSDGLQVSSSSSTYDLIDGMLPIGELPAAAQIAASVTAVGPPLLA